MGEALKTVYHYCSNEAFFSIINNASIRLSSLSLSNDKTEGKLVSKIFKDLATEESVKTDDLLEYIKVVEENCHALGFCLSSEGDSLSQWRGYADNASGVSIGFSKEYLEQLADKDELQGNATRGQFAQVEYDPAKQRALVQPVFKEMNDIVVRGGLKQLSDNSVSAAENNNRLYAYNELFIKKMNLLPEIFRLKDGAFSEEKEWRLFVPLDVTELVHGYEWRVSGEKMVPYRDFPVDRSSAIQEVILGPRNLNSKRVVTGFLESNNFWGVNVRKSKIPFQ